MAERLRGAKLDAALAAAIGQPSARPDRRWIGNLTGAPMAEIERALGELASKLDEERAVRETLRAGGREFYAQISAPAELYALTRLIRPDHVVELGVSSGISSTHFLLGLTKNRRGRLHSVDLPTFQEGAVHAAHESPVAIPPNRRSGWAVPRRLRTGWDLRIGPTQGLLGPLVAELPRLDLFLHDDLHTPRHLKFELETIRPLLHPGSVVLADNTNWTGRSFPAFARSLGARVHRRRGTYLVGLRVPAARSAAAGRAGSGASARRRSH